MTPKYKMAAQYVSITAVMKHFLVVFAASLVLTRIESEDIREDNQTRHGQIKVEKTEKNAKTIDITPIDASVGDLEDDTTDDGVSEKNTPKDLQDIQEEEETCEIQDTHSCGKCDVVFNNLQDYIQHKLSKDNCQVSFIKSQRRLIPHLKVRPPPPQPKTAQSSRGRKRGQKGDWLAKAHSAQNIISNPTKYACETCGRMFTREAAYRRHREYDHQDSNDDENNKSQASNSASKLKIRKISSEPPDIKPVDVNDKATEDAMDGLLLLDKFQPGTPRPYVCAYCGKSFKEMTVLRSHKLTHSSRRDYRCDWDECNYSFKTKGSLKRHLRRHTGERPFQCNQCGRKFGESGALTRHMKSRTPCSVKSDSELPRYGSRCQFRQDIPAAESKPLSEQDSIPIKFERSVPKKQYKDITVENDADGAAKFMVVSLKKTPQPSKVIADENFMQLAMNRAQQADNDGQIVHVIHLPAPGAQILNPENMDYSDILVDGQQKIITLQGNVNDPMLEMADESSKYLESGEFYSIENEMQSQIEGVDTLVDSRMCEERESNQIGDELQDMRIIELVQDGVTTVIENPFQDQSEDRSEDHGNDVPPTSLSGMVEPSEGFLEKDTKEYVNTSEQLAIEVLQNADDKITPNVLLAAKIMQCESPLRMETDELTEEEEEVSIKIMKEEEDAYQPQSSDNLITEVSASCKEMTYSKGDEFTTGIVRTVFADNEDYKGEEQQQSVSDYNTCMVCEENFEAIDSLAAHLKQYLAHLPFRCGVCIYATADKESLIVHKKVNNHYLSQDLTDIDEDEIDLQLPAKIITTAEESRKATMALNQLMVLLKTQGQSDEQEATENGRIRGVKIFHPCPVCPRTFPSPSYLTLHMRSHTGEKPHACILCGKTFASQDTLGKHQVVHSGERNYKCGECGKLFKRISHVREHLKVHSNERPYSCSICGKSFKTVNACKVHMRIHSNLMPYKCNHCRRQFRERGSMERHLRTHTGEKPYSCKRCGRRFAEHGTLNRHLKSKVPCDPLYHHREQLLASSQPVRGRPDTQTLIQLATNTAMPVDVLPTMEEKEASTVLASLSSVDTSVDTKTQYLMQDKDKKLVFVNPADLTNVDDGTQIFQLETPSDQQYIMMEKSSEGEANQFILMSPDGAVTEVEQHVNLYQSQYDGPVSGGDQQTEQVVEVANVEWAAENLSQVNSVKQERGLTIGAGDSAEVTQRDKELNVISVEEETKS